MSTNVAPTSAVHSRRLIPLRRLVWLMCLLAACAAGVQAQTVTTLEGNETPGALKPGSPIGSYGLSNIESINLYNGNLSANLPLLQVGGRGDASYTITQLLTRPKATASHNLVIYWSGSTQRQTWNSYPAVEPKSNYYAVGFGPGIVQGRSIGKHYGRCASGGGSYNAYYQTFTFLEFTAPDGTESALYSEQNNNIGSGCEGAIDRGRIFSSRDGAGMTFVSDWGHLDNTAPFSAYSPNEEVLLLYGYLLMPNGTRYRIEKSLVKWISDRNGNRLDFVYDTYGSVTQVTDSLGRIITFQYNVSDGSYGVCHRIIYSGVGGAQRIIRVSSSSFNSTFSAWMADGKRFIFYYNTYGEITRVELSTGGAVEYDYAAGVVGTNSSGQIGESEYMANSTCYQDGECAPPVPPKMFFYRRLIERRVYPAGGTGSTYESRTTYSRPESGSCTMQYYTFSVCTFSGVNYVQEDSYNKPAQGGQILASVRHHFNGRPAADMYAELYNFNPYPDTTKGKETLTEMFNGQTVVRSVSNTWQARLRGPVVTDSTTTLADTNLVSKQVFEYDAYNNRKDEWEYAYGTGTPGALVRYTQTAYLTSNNGVAYDTINPNAASPAINSTYHLRSLPLRESVFDAAGVERARTVYEYDNYNADTYHAPLESRSGIIGLCDTTTTSTGNSDQCVLSNPTAFTARGNVTAVTNYADAAALTGAVTTYSQYDVAGNIVKSIDARGKVAEVIFTDAFSDGVNRNTFAYPTMMKSPIPDPANARATNTPIITTSVYDFSTGRVMSGKDANGQVNGLSTTYEYSDVLGRLGKVNNPDGGWTEYWYDRNAYGDYIGSRTKINDTQNTESYQFFDGLGRVVRTFQHDGSQWSTVDIQYDALGRVWRTSNQYLSGGSGTTINPSGQWTTITYDALGRLSTVTAPDNAVVTTTYYGNSVTVTDAAGKRRTSVTDALGRLSTIYEDPNVSNYTGFNYQTNYTYDVMGNLRKVEQGGQLRYFMYDSLGRLIRAKNPEQNVNAGLALTDSFKAPEDVQPNSQWTLKFTYNANGNLETKTDARGVTTTHQYDNIDRLIQTNYSDGTPYTLHTYDFATNGRGLYYADYESSTSGTINVVTAYDVMGRPKEGKAEFYLDGAGWVPAYTTLRDYDKMGNVIKQTYPSGRVVNYTQFDAAARLKQLTGTLGDGVTRTYTTGITYDEGGKIKKEQFGTQTPLYHKLRYNTRRQLYDVRLSTVDDADNWNRGLLVNHYSHYNGVWGAEGVDNNGNLLRSHHYVPNDDQVSGYRLFYQDYEYDALNRVKKVTEINNVAWAAQYAQAYDYDRWGNRNINAGQTWGVGINNKQFTIDPATNRLGVPSGPASVMSYDFAGNLVNDTYTGAGTRTYNAENRMTSAQGTSLSTGTFTNVYTYDAAGKRVRRKAESGEVWQVYGLGGELVAEYARGAAPAVPQKEYGYRNEELLVISEGTSTTMMDDWVWIEDALPAGAQTSAGGINEAWNWTASSPSPVSGASSHRSPATAGLHQQYFQNATATMAVGASDNLVAYVYLDPANLPSELMLQWHDNATGWDHRAYWGADQIGWGTDGTVSRRYMGALPAAGKWVKLEVPAAAVGLAGQTVHGLALTLYGGRANLDRAGKVTVGRPQWLVSDHLGTPRMIADITGNLDKIKRHDYLPFGEELYANTGGRAAAHGYAGDNVRQKFTRYERDGETELDFAKARYYTSVQGRFASVDPDNAGVNPEYPQTWNGYAYVNNRPTVFVDPDGREVIICDLNGKCGRLSDPDANRYFFNKAYQRANGYYVSRGKVYDTAGNQIGTYENTCCDWLRGSWQEKEVNRLVTGKAFDDAVPGAIVNVVTKGLTRGNTSNRVKRRWEITKAGTDKVVVHKTFGTISRHKKTGHWWSKDKAEHGHDKKSVWKVFKETPQGLEHIADADEYGNYIRTKHKGPVGEFIPWKDLRGR